jgi:hypothetical protein
MKYRQSIISALEMLTSDIAQKLTTQQKKNKIKAWHIGLHDISDQDIYCGLQKALSNSSGFILSSGQFRELCITDDSITTSESEALESWNLVMSNLNVYVSPIFKNSVIAETIRRMGGWVKLCSMLTKDEPFKKKEFIEMYAILKRRNQGYKPILSGIHKNYQKLIGYTEQEKNIKEKILQQAKKFRSDESKIIDMIKRKTT